MVGFLLKRPIAVLMAFLAAVILGVVTYMTLPVSLLPSIDIPQVTVRASVPGTGAQELENTVTAPLRRQLMQVGGLEEIKSESRDGSALIKLHFEYGVDTDLAFVEVNEKIDAAMNGLPRSVKRPRAVKASATDVPVLYLNMTLKGDGSFTQMAEVARDVVRRRIEQLQEVAMADMTGVPEQQLRIVPDPNAMASLGIGPEEINRALSENNSDPGSMTVRDGAYEYNIHISNQLRTPDDVRRIWLRQGGRLIRLGDVARIEQVADNPRGYSFFGNRQAVTLAVIKQGESNMDDLKRSLSETVSDLERQYPEIEFSQSRNQTELLDYAIGNLVQNLILGFLLVFMLTALFMGEVRSAIVIGLSIMVSVVITFLVFYLFGVSLNIISLSGLILAVGMMIDNSVIVTENITQFRQRGLPLAEACDAGTTEMITPMLSSSLTTVAVFVPLVFMSGIAGAIFRDQAFAITSGLGVSYVVAVMLLPVLCKLVFRKSRRVKQEGRGGKRMERAYTVVVGWCFRHKVFSVGTAAGALVLCPVMFLAMPIERLPEIERDDTVLRVDWNENLHIDENARRVGEVISEVCGADSTVNSAYAGDQDYMLDAGRSMSASESEIYLKARSAREIGPLSEAVREAICGTYPKARVETLPAENIFDKIFTTDEPELEVRLSRRGGIDVDSLVMFESSLGSRPTPLSDRIDIVPNAEALLLYRVPRLKLDNALTAAFNANSGGVLRSYQEYIPITISTDGKTVDETLSETLIGDVPLSSLVRKERSRDLKSVTAGADGQYVPYAFDGLADPEAKIEEVRTLAERSPGWEASFAGAIFSNRKMMNELTVILGVSVLMMYFILCAQFGGFVQPLIVLAEIPIDTAFALLSLWIFGHTLNLMSAIGIIVTCGIVVNDSILKLDAINTLRGQGLPLMDAIHTAGVRRLRPIVMTSLTTILAMVPTLFTHDMGSQLQQPLAIAMIGSMVMGTLVSIFIIPVVYWLIYRKK